MRIIQEQDKVIEKIKEQILYYVNEIFIIEDAINRMHC
jgi:hypothetical protein